MREINVVRVRLVERKKVETSPPTMTSSGQRQDYTKEE